MANSDLKTKLTIEADAQGSEEIIRLRQQVDKLGAAADEASPEFAQLADELKRLGQSQAAIAQFERLKTSTQQTAKQLQQLQQATREAALALKEQERAVAQATAANHKTGEQLKQQRTYQDELRTSIKALAAEYKAQAQAAKASGDTSAQTAQRLADTRAQLGVLRTEYREAATNAQQLGRAQRDSAQALDAANKAQAQAAKQFEGLRKDTQQTKQALAEQNISLQRARDRLGELSVASSGLARAQQDMGRNLAAAQQQIARLAAEAEQAAQVLADRELLGVRAHAEVQKEIEATRAAYERLKASGQLSQAELAQAALKTEERIRELKHQTNGWTESLGKARGAFAALAASGAGLAAMAKRAVDFESAMADVAKVVDGTEQQINALASRIKEMTREIPLAAQELAQIAAAGGQLGVPLQKLDQFVLLAAQMATAFNLSADQAGQAVAKLSNIFNLPLEQVRELGDAINTLGNTMAAKEGDIVEVLTRIGGTAKQFGLSAQQAAALGAAMLSLGVSAEVAGTGINAILSKLQTAGVQSKDFQAALQEMGISAQQLAADIQAHPQRALNEFLRTLSKLEGTQKAEILSRLFGTEYQDDVARLLAGLDGYGAALERVGNASQTAGAMQKEFAARTQTTEAQLKQLKNSIDEVAINLGSVLLPLLRKVASGVSSAAQAVAELVERFPELTKVATVLVTLAANAAALRLAWLALGVAGAKAFAGVAAQVGALNVGMQQLAAQSSIAAAAIKSAGLLAASGWTGWNIGSTLREEFLVVEQAGIALAAGLTKAAARAQHYWESLKAVFTDDTLEAAEERLAQKLRQIDDDYAALFESAAQARQGQEQLAQSAETAAAAVQQQTAQTQQAAAAMGQAMAGAVQTIDQVDQAMQRAGASAQATASALQEAFAQAIGQAKTLADIEALEKKLKDLEAAGRIGAEGVKAITEAIARQRQSIEATDKARQDMLEGFKELGTDGAAALGQISEGAQKAIDAVDKIAAAAKEAGLGVNEAAQAIEKAFTAAVPKADSLQALDALQQRLKAAGQAGHIGAEGIARVQAALDKQRAAIEEQLPGIQSLEQALKQLGVTPVRELQELARRAREAFEAVKQSGQATPREINEAWRKMAEAAIEANGGVADAALRAQAAQHGFALQADESGKVVIKAMQGAARATREVGQASREAARQMQQMQAPAQDVEQAVYNAIERHKEAGKTITSAWLSASAAASQYAQEAARHAHEMVGAMEVPGRVLMSWSQLDQLQAEHLAKLGRVADEYVRAMQAIDAQQQALSRSNSSAAQGVDDLRLRLLELGGTEAEIARERHRRDELRIEREIQLAQLELQRAQLRGDEQAAQRLQQDIAHLREQIQLLDKIHAIEERNRKARAREEAQRGGQAGGGGAGGLPPPAPAPAPQPAPPAPPVHITLNANGVNDPLRLARLIEPELRRMAQLAR
ncbi:phage tail tape measure protein [Vandammella animalimorsus]|uniref:Phage tail tape measure protein n=1 Tax=Vandammella animalimorsus TaxID=2029117 RepID=A0A3M6RVB6_9BURK|nr:phage tail tape measure protein [Vandammella animalimorsus]RMX18854.1 phage tail tape measure protein [Vandammella animalimorsus]